MENINKKIELLFQDFGTIELMDVNEDNDYLYLFMCNPKSICTKKNLFYNFNPIKFVIICSSNSKCDILCFRIGTNNDDKDKNKTLYALNEVNRTSEYGKYILDSDNDIDWTYSFDLNNINSEDIKNILISFFESLYKFVFLIIRGKNE